MIQNKEEQAKKETPEPPKQAQGLSLSMTLTLIFVTLKLIGSINWHWMWVLSPLWISLILELMVAAIVATLLAIADSKKNQK